MNAGVFFALNAAPTAREGASPELTHLQERTLRPNHPTSFPQPQIGQYFIPYDAFSPGHHVFQFCLLSEVKAITYLMGLEKNCDF